MSGDYEIKITTPAQTGGIAKTTEDLKKLGITAEDVKKKIDAMFAAEQKLLKEQRVFGDQSQQTAAHLSKLTQEAKASAASADKAAGMKARWGDALKKLTGQIPGLGFALGALKNPLVALVAVIAIFIDSLAKIKEHIDLVKDAVGDGKIITNFETIGAILRQSRMDAEDLVAELEKIKGRPDNLQEVIAKRQANFDRGIRREERADERDVASGKLSPEEADARAKLREQRKLGAAANFATQGKFMAQDALRSGQAALPAEADALAAARDRNRRQLELADAQETPAGKLAELQKQVDDFEAILNTPGYNRSYGQLQLTSAYGGEAGLTKARDLALGNLQNAQRGNVTVGALRASAGRDLGLAEKRFATFSAGLASNAEDVRSFGGQIPAALADAGAAREFNDPGFAARDQQTAFAQRRGDALTKQNQQVAQATQLMTELAPLMKAIISTMTQLKADQKRLESSQ